MTSPLRLAVVEDQPLYREMLIRALSDLPHLSVVAVAGTGAEAMRTITPGSIDVALLDVELPDGNGLALGMNLRRNDPSLAVVMLSATDSMDLLLELPPAMRGGWSYLSKTSGTDLATLSRTITETAAGGTVLDPELLARSTPRTGSGIAKLTGRQFEVLKLVAEGLSNAGIAQRLGLAEKSVQNHLNTIYAALELQRDTDRNARVSATLQLLEDTRRP